MPVNLHRLFFKPKRTLGVLCSILAGLGFLFYSCQPRNFLPDLYVITATYARYSQRAELTRLCHTLLHVKNVHWIVVEDSNSTTSLVTKLLFECGVPNVHLNAVAPPGSNKGAAQRNRGLQWIRENLKPDVNRGVLYVADDDNAYTLRVFEEMRYTRRVSTWPVGFAGGLLWEGCVTSTENRSVIAAMWTWFMPDRRFPIDMAGFAVNIDLVLSHFDADFAVNHSNGLQETLFIEKLGLSNWTELEPKADGCQEVLVWHTRTHEPNLEGVYALGAKNITAPPIKGSV